MLSLSQVGENRRLIFPEYSNKECYLSSLRNRSKTLHQGPRIRPGNPSQQNDRWFESPDNGKPELEEKVAVLQEKVDRLMRRLKTLLAD